MDPLFDTYTALNYPAKTPIACIAKAVTMDSAGFSTPRQERDITNRDHIKSVVRHDTSYHLLHGTVNEDYEVLKMLTPRAANPSKAKAELDHGILAPKKPKALAPGVGVIAPRVLFE